MPVDDIVPISYSLPKSGGPACGLLARGPKSLVFFDILSGDDGNYPYCANVSKVVAFKLAGKSYLAFEFWHQALRDEAFDDFFYVRRDDAGYWQEAKDVSDRAKEDTMPGNIKDSIRNVRANDMAKSFPGQQMLYRDFIGDDDGAFGVLSRPNACTFVVDAATTRATFKHEDFAPGQPCSTFVASSRFDKGATAYYIGLFDGPQKKRQLALFSVSHNVIKAEKGLAAQAASKGQLADIKSVKQFLTTAAKP